MAKITGWDKLRNGLGLGYSKKTEAALAEESAAVMRMLAQQAEERVAAIKKAEAEKKAAEAKAKAPVAKKPVSKSQEKRVAIQKDAADTPVAKKTPATKKTTPKKSGK